MTAIHIPLISPSIDCNVTATWNFTGELQVKGVDVATTANSFDPSSNQTITGNWGFNGSLKVGGVPVYGGFIQVE